MVEVKCYSQVFLRILCAAQRTMPVSRRILARSAGIPHCCGIIDVDMNVRLQGVEFKKSILYARGGDFIL